MKAEMVKKCLSVESVFRIFDEKTENKEASLVKQPTKNI